VSTAHDWLRRDGMTVREIARALRISSNRVRQLEQSALEKLRQNPRIARQLFQFVDFDSDVRPPEGATR
jgi:DNA-directed RNA polymerase sigma subunit (sigma70/sigma32)